MTDLNNLSTLAAASTATVRISTVPTAIPAAHFQLVCKRNSTEKNPIPEAQRLRVVNIPEQFLTLPQDATRSKFHALLQTTILDLAQEVFKAWAAENLSAVEFDPRRVTLDSVLQHWATVKESQRVDADKITDWLKTCATMESFTEAKRAAWLRRVPKFGGNHYRNEFSKSDAESLAAQIVDADASHPIAVFILNRCAVILSAPDSAKDAL